MRAIFSLLLVAGLLTSCSQSGSSGPRREGTLHGDPNFVSKGKFIAVIDTAAGVLSPAASATIPVSVIVAPDVAFTVDSTAFVVPTITNDVLDFGSVLVTSLRDNGLKVCGADGKTKCTKALIRVYTTGVAGAGLWNADGGYGAPITTNLSGATPATVGLEAAGAATVQSYTIPATKNVLNLSDFGATPKYLFNVDFTNAGAGTYGTTLVIEYGLSL